MYIHLLHLGRIPYAEGLALQQQVVAARKQNLIGDTLLLLEHPPVLTLGRNASRSNVLASDEFLAQRGIELHEINRGGDVTYHGPGQLVGYPIIDLRGDLPGKKGPHLGPVDYVRLLEEVLIRTCGDFGVMAQRIAERTGVWTIAGGSIQEKKIAAIGVHVSQGVTSHGFALNVTTDLRDFEWIVPCGITDRQVTSLELEADSDQPAHHGERHQLHRPQLRPRLRAADALVRIARRTASPRRMRPPAKPFTEPSLPLHVHPANAHDSQPPAPLPCGDCDQASSPCPLHDVRVRRSERPDPRLAAHAGPCADTDLAGNAARSAAGCGAGDTQHGGGKDALVAGRPWVAVETSLSPP